MVLSFNPPQDLINAYLNRPSPGQIASEGINQALQTYASEKDAQQKEALAQQAKDIEMAKGLANNGQDFTDAYKQIVASRTPQPNAQATPNAQGPSLIDRWKAKFGMSPVGKSPTGPDMTQPPTPSTGTVSGMPPGYPPMASDTATPPAPVSSPTTDPLVQEYQKDPIAFKRQHGEAGITKLKTQAEIDKLLGTKGPLQTITKEQALANGSYDPSKQYIVEPPQSKGGPNADEKLSDKQLADAQKAYNSDKNREKADAVIEKVSQAVPLLNAGTIDNATAKQALQTAMTYMATGGMRVNEVELRQFGGANALTNKMAQWYKGLDAGTLTSRDAQDMGKVLDIFQNSAKQNLQQIGLRHTHQYLKRSNSGETEADAFGRVTGNDFTPPTAPGQSRPTITNQKDYDALPQGSQYQDRNGVPHTKGLR